MPLLTAEDITNVCFATLRGAGVPEDRCRTVASHLARANLLGHDSHGIQNLPYMLMMLKKGMSKGEGEWKIVRETPSTALIDGGMVLGQVVCSEAVKLVVKKAKSTGMGSVGIFNCAHIGRLGDYTTSIAENGMIGILYANSLPAVAPSGGRSRVLGTNPMSYAFPVRGGFPVMVDFATSTVAEGKVRAALHKGEKIPEGWILDREGKPSTNPSDLYAKPNEPNSAGALLPAAGYKGYGLALVVDLMSGAMTGSGSGSEVKVVKNGVFLEAIDIESFAPIEEYYKHVEHVVSDIKSAALSTGSNEILLPGEPESRTKEKRARDGIQVADSTWQDVVKAAKEVNVDVESLVKRKS